MKKTAIFIILILSIIVSMVAGTLAIYTKTLEPLDNDIIAKRFYIDTPETAFPNIELAPSESVEWVFSVVNYKSSNIITEVDMDLTVTLKVDTLSGKNPIDGLVVSIYNESGKQMGTTIAKQGEMNFFIGKAFIANESKNYKFKLIAEWIDGQASNQADTINASLQDISLLSVSINGTQCIHNNHNETLATSPTASPTPTISPTTSPTVSPTPTPPINESDLYYDDVEVTLEKSGNKKYLLKIKNKSGKDIKDGWVIDLNSAMSDLFSLPIETKSGNLWSLFEIQRDSNNKPISIRPKEGLYYSTLYDIKKNGSIVIDILLNNEPTTEIILPNSDEIKLKKPYDQSKVTVSFDDTIIDPYNSSLYIYIKNDSQYGSIYGWNIEFKTNANLGYVDGINTKLISNVNGIYTYNINKPSNTNSGIETYISYGQKNRVYYKGTQTMPTGSLTIYDVLLNGKPVNYIAP